MTDTERCGLGLYWGQFRSLSDRARAGWQRPPPSGGGRPSRRGAVPPPPHSGGSPRHPSGSLLGRDGPARALPGRAQNTRGPCAADPGDAETALAEEGAPRGRARQEGTRGCRCAGSLGATAGTRLSRPIPRHGAAGGTPALRCPAHHGTVAHRPTGLRQGDDTSDPASARRSRPEFKSRALTKRCF